MTRRRPKEKEMSRKWLLAASVLSVAALLAGNAGAEVAVRDSRVIAESTKTATNTAEAVNRLTEILDLVSEIHDAVGMPGPPEKTLDSLPEWEPFKSGGKMLDVLRDFTSNLTDVVKGDAGDAGSIPEGETTLPQVRSFIEKAFFAGGPVGDSQRLDYQEVRRRANREADLTGYSLAIVSRDHLAQAGDRAQQLDSMVNTTENLREDVRANSAVLLASYQQLAHVQALVTSLLEIEATAGLSGDMPLVAEGGGQTPPDVRRDADYDSSGERVQVSGAGTGTLRNAGLNVNQFKSFDGTKDADSSISAPLSTIGSLLDGKSSGYINDIMRSAGAGGYTGIVNDIQSASKRLTSTGSSDMDQANALIYVAQQIARRSGNSDLSRSISQINSAVRLSNNAGSVLSGSGTSSVNQTVGLLSDLARISGNSELNNLVKVARQAQSTTNSSGLGGLLSGTQGTTQAGTIRWDNPNQTSTGGTIRWDNPNWTGPCRPNVPLDYRDPAMAPGYYCD